MLTDDMDLFGSGSEMIDPIDFEIINTHSTSTWHCVTYMHVLHAKLSYVDIYLGWGCLYTSALVYIFIDFNLQVKNTTSTSITVEWDTAPDVDIIVYLVTYNATQLPEGKPVFMYSVYLYIYLDLDSQPVICIYSIRVSFHQLYFINPSLYH